MMLQPEGVKEQENLVCMVEQISVRFKESSGVRTRDLIPSKASVTTDWVFRPLMLYVDDMLEVGPNKVQIQELKAQLARKYEKDLEPANKDFRDANSPRQKR